MNKTYFCLVLEGRLSFIWMKRRQEVSMRFWYDESEEQVRSSDAVKRVHAAVPHDDEWVVTMEQERQEATTCAAPLTRSLLSVITNMSKWTPSRSARVPSRCSVTLANDRASAIFFISKRVTEGTSSLSTFDFTSESPPVTRYALVIFQLFVVRFCGESLFINNHRIIVRDITYGLLYFDRIKTTHYRFTLNYMAFRMYFTGAPNVYNIYYIYNHQCSISSDAFTTGHCTCYEKNEKQKNKINNSLESWK